MLVCPYDCIGHARRRKVPLSSASAGAFGMTSGLIQKLMGKLFCRNQRCAVRVAGCAGGGGAGAT